MQLEKSLYNINDVHDACGVGFVASLDNKAQHKIVENALTAMAHLTHRGGCEDDEKMSDGSGILMPIPLSFFKKQFNSLEHLENWGLGSFFFPPEPFLQENLMDIVRMVAKDFGFRIEEIRKVPTDLNILSRKVLANLPDFFHILFVSTKKEQKLGIEKDLYILRKQIEYAAFAFLEKHNKDLSLFHMSSLSSQTIVYKGILPGKNLALFYPDLLDSDFKTTFAIFHERFSTNTMPTWNLAQPFRAVAHNGEINTIRGNKTQMSIRENVLKSKAFGDSLKYVMPCVEKATSDSGAFDNVFEFLLQNGYSVPRAVMTMIPEAISKEFDNDAKKTAFYKYHMHLMEAWDGPTNMVFTDGKNRIGARLDRNGLRPCRYSITKDNIVILSSEVGVLSLAQEDYKEHGQLKPRSIFILDLEKGMILDSDNVKEEAFNAEKYQEIIANTQNVLAKSDKAYSIEAQSYKEDYANFFGYARKLSEKTIISMVEAKEEPVGAMGLDQPLAVLNPMPQSLFNYFKQLFAQVTNPSIDPIREKLSMSLSVLLGGKENLFQDTKEMSKHYYLDQPILFQEQIEAIEKGSIMKSQRLDISLPYKEDFDAFAKSLDTLCIEAAKAVKEGKRVLILSDKKANKDTMPMPVLLALGAVHQYLIRNNLRHLSDIIVETAQAYEVMHMALLTAFGANAIYPYGAFSAIKKYVDEDKLSMKDYESAVHNYEMALEKGLLKVLARLGISTLSSFTGAQCYEALGLHSSIVDKYFTGTYARIGGVKLEDVYKEMRMRYSFFIGDDNTLNLEDDVHAWTKDVRTHLREAVEKKDYAKYTDFTKELEKTIKGVTLRSIYSFKEVEKAKLSDVESIDSIIKRFCSAPMSLGALSQESHETIALACNRLNIGSNCGEGGEERRRTLSRGSKEDLCSRIRQIASGRFGVTAEYLSHADEVQIKIAQGAKPGEGGQLPAKKVNEYIAKVRHTLPNVSLISPPPHHDIYSIEDLAQLIYDIKKLRKGLKVSVKLVAQAGIGTVAVGVVKAGADTICISGHDGGTGAAPLSSVYHVGLPWELGLADVHQALIINAMRYKVNLQVDGQMYSGKDAVVAFMLGADEISFGTSLLVSMGCILCRQCYKGACPVGICTQSEKLREKFKGSAENIENYFHFLAEDIRSQLASLGVTSVEELIGRADLLDIDTNTLPDKAKYIDMSLLFQNLPYIKKEKKGANPIEEEPWEEELLVQVKNALDTNAKAEFYQRVKNTHRAVGTNIAGMIAHLDDELAEDRIRLNFSGNVGQSFGAFAPKGLNLSLKGSANDYVGKGLCGGTIAVSPDLYKVDKYMQSQSIMGNVVLYGATSGKLFACGTAGERFAVRNSGALAVVHGVGDHACEYMTGGTVVILGKCGYNFAAGMSGGVIYWYDETNLHKEVCNNPSLDIDPLDNSDKEKLQNILQEHAKTVHSVIAQEILEDFAKASKSFVKIIPQEYKQMLLEQEKA